MNQQEYQDNQQERFIEALNRLAAAMERTADATEVSAKMRQGPPGKLPPVEPKVDPKDEKDADLPGDAFDDEVPF